MYLSDINIKYLKRIRNLTLDFKNKDGSPRMWTVLVGPNGTAKTTILQAIAMTAAGKMRVSEVAGQAVSSLRSKLATSGILDITSNFSFSKQDIEDNNNFKRKTFDLTESSTIRSNLKLLPYHTTFKGSSKLFNNNTEESTNHGTDPLDEARSVSTPGWFVIGYGAGRFLPESGRIPDLSSPAITRLKPLFANAYGLSSTSFINHFGNETDLSYAFSRKLRQVIATSGIIPDIVDLELRGYKGIRSTKDLIESDRFSVRMGDRNFKIQALALSHGMQSSIAWVADLIGHIVFETEGKLNPEEMCGLVLIDEIDLYLHPIWQCDFIQALRTAFPRMQFIATTHSPAVISNLQAEEIIRLEEVEGGFVSNVAIDPSTGEIINVEPGVPSFKPDPRVMSGSEIFTNYFKIPSNIINKHGELLREYLSLANDTERNNFEEERVRELQKLLLELGVTNIDNILPR